jgi:hypothetical protein
VDLQIITDPDVFLFIRDLTARDLQRDYPKHARAQKGNPSRKQKPPPRAEVRIIAHPSEVPQKITVETGPQGVIVHLGGN